MDTYLRRRYSCREALAGGRGATQCHNVRWRRREQKERLGRKQRDSLSVKKKFPIGKKIRWKSQSRTTVLGSAFVRRGVMVPHNCCGSLRLLKVVQIQSHAVALNTNSLLQFICFQVSVLPFHLPRTQSIAFMLSTQLTCKRRRTSPAMASPASFVPASPPISFVRMPSPPASFESNTV